MSARGARHGSVHLVVVVLAAAGIAGWFLGAKRRRKSGRPAVPGGGRHPAPVPPTGVEFGEAVFPPTKVGQRWEHLQRLAATAEEVTGFTGLYSYLLGMSKGESNGVPSAINTKTDGPGALRLLCRDANYNGRYKNNPWRPDECSPEDPKASRWAYSGGWFQLMPAVGLATADKRAHTHDPARVFDPPFAVAYACDLVYRLQRGTGAQTWGDIRAGWALPKWARPDSEAEGKAVVLERFERRLGQVASMGADPGLAVKPVNTSHYPGFKTVLHALLAAEGRTAAG